MRYLNLFVNYSYQWMPEIEDFPAGATINDVNWPAENRFNAGLNFNYSKWLGNFSVNYTDEAYWQDVLDARFAGTTDAFTLVNGAIGYRWCNDKIVTSLKLTNIANQEVQQHIFGDVMRAAGRRRGSLRFLSATPRRRSSSAGPQVRAFQPAVARPRGRRPRRPSLRSSSSRDVSGRLHLWPDV